MRAPPAAAPSRRNFRGASMTDHGATVRRPVLVMEGVSKSFFGVQVLHGVDLDLRPGEVHVLMGENGAGKSTLMKILVGAQPADSGRIVLDGEDVSFGHPAEAQARGISIIYQEFNLLPQHSVAENVFLGREPKRGWLVNRARMEADTRRILEMLQVADVISPRARVADLSVAQQQMVEIAKALSVDARVLVMDEPTAALSPHEVEALMVRIRLLQERGVGILYISHRLPEVFALAARITVLKDGRRVDTVLRDDVQPAQLVAMMVGRELSTYYPPRAHQPPGDVRLRVTGGGGGILHDVDLELRAGEIVGLAGLEGSGRTELARALFGADPFERGVVEIDGRPVRIKNPRRAIASGLGFITEDRKGEGLVLGRSVVDNATLALRSVPRWADGGNLIYAVLGVALIIAWPLVDVAGGDFMSGDSIRSILLRSISLGIVAMGQTLVIVAGSLDLSVAFVISITTVVAASTINGEASRIPLGVGLVLAFGAVVGLLNGLIITKTRTNPFIATLGMSLVLQGLLQSEVSAAKGAVPSSFQALGYKSLGPVPFAVLLLLVVFAAFYFLQRYTGFGAHLYAVGGDVQTARLSGVRSDRVLIKAHVLCSLAAVVAGL